MLDIKLIRENPELVKANLAKRGNPDVLQMLEELITVDKAVAIEPYQTKRVAPRPKTGNNRNR